MADNLARRDVEIVTLASANPDQKTAFENWVMSMKPDVDNEDGASAWEWLMENAATFPRGGPHATFIAFLKGADTPTPVATATLTPDDRGVAASKGLNCLGFVGLVNVHRDYRGRGLGSIIFEEVDETVFSYTDELAEDAGKPANGEVSEEDGGGGDTGQSLVVHFFTWPEEVRENNPMRNIGDTYGYDENKDIRVGDDPDDYETLWTKDYSASM